MSTKNSYGVTYYEQPYTISFNNWVVGCGAVNYSSIGAGTTVCDHIMVGCSSLTSIKVSHWLIGQTNIAVSKNVRCKYIVAGY